MRTLTSRLQEVVKLWPACVLVGCAAGEAERVNTDAAPTVEALDPNTTGSTLLNEPDAPAPAPVSVADWVCAGEVQTLEVTSSGDLVDGGLPEGTPSCAADLPVVDGQPPDPAFLNFDVLNGDQRAVLVRVSSGSECETTNHLAWYLVAPTRIGLCVQTCDALDADPSAALELVPGCY